VADLTMRLKTSQFFAHGTMVGVEIQNKIIGKRSYCTTFNPSGL